MRKAKRITPKMLEDARYSGVAEGRAAGSREEWERYRPLPALERGLGEFVKTIEAWPLPLESVVVVIATDAKTICQMGIAFRALAAIAGELKRLGYGEPK